MIGSFLYLPLREVEDRDALVRSLVVTPKYEEKPLSLYDGRGMERGWIGVPLYFLGKDPEDLCSNVVDRRIVSPCRIESRSTLRPEQSRVIREFTRHVENGKRGFILEAPPGFGKTVTAIKMLEVVGQKTLVVVPRSNLIKQWVERLGEHSSLRESEVGWVEGGKGDWRNKKVVVGLVHSLALDRYSDEFRKTFGCVVFDEVDRSVPPATFAPVVSMFPSLYRIGMSAVVKRQDGMEVVFEYHMGGVRLSGGDEGRMKPTVLVHFYPDSSGYVHMGSARLNRRGMLISRLGENFSRNHIVANYVKLIWKSDRRCLVLSDRKMQLQQLRGFLMEMKIPDRDIGYYMRSLASGVEIPESERRRVGRECKVILATYGMFSIGTDIPDLAGLVYATPQSEVKQSSGRIERLLEGKKDPVVVDMVDVHYSDAMRWFEKRNQVYQSLGLKVKRVA